MNSLSEATANKTYPLPTEYGFKKISRDYLIADFDNFVETCLVVWESILEDRRGVAHEPVLPNFAQWDDGIVALREFSTELSPSVMAVYNELTKLDISLPCYDYVVVPLIVGVFDSNLNQFQENVPSVVIDEETARAIALGMKDDLIEVQK